MDVQADMCHLRMAVYCSLNSSAQCSRWQGSTWFEQLGVEHPGRAWLALLQLDPIFRPVARFKLSVPTDITTPTSKFESCPRKSA